VGTVYGVRDPSFSSTARTIRVFVPRPQLVLRALFFVSVNFIFVSVVLSNRHKKYLFLSQLLKMVDTKNESLFCMMVEIISLFFVMVEIISCHHKKSPTCYHKIIFLVVRAGAAVCRSKDLSG
jgi:hypothetical protein